MKNLPNITWCSKCVVPDSSAVTLTFDEEHICSGCKVHMQKKNINWSERLEWLLEDIEPYRKSSGYECIIGVSGGKDSYYQTHFVKETLGLNPLLVTYNGNNYLDQGWKNLQNMKNVFNVDHIIYSPGTDLLIRLNRLGFRMMGDMNWHNHAGIATTPMRMASDMNIPLVFYGEHGWMDLGGMHSMHDMVEYTSRYRKDQLLRGYDWSDMLNDKKEKITEKEMEWCKYPNDEAINKIGLRGLFIGNYDPWDANEHTKLVKEKYNWKESPVPFERTYRRFSNLDDMYENGVHDYLKYIKFGYGRGTDHACKDIRSGYMTREEGIKMVKKYDHIRSNDTDHWLNYVGMDSNEFIKIADSFRSDKVWIQLDSGEWKKRNLWDESN